MKSLYYILGLTLCFFIVSCGGNAEKQNTKGMNTAKVGVEVDAANLATMKDVVCGMSMANVAITDTAAHNGKIYPFCAKACKETFKKEVDKYVVN
ncbi:MAG: hypothetical protein ACPG5B_12265 [Chitinophagales bacterium]